MKEKIRKFHDSLFKKEVIDNKKKRTLFLLVFYFTLVSTFITIFGQIPRISAAGATKFFQIGWAIVIVPMIFLDYKQFIRSFVTVFLVSFPFLAYELILLPIGINSISYQGTIYIFLVLFIFLEGMVLGKYLNFNFLKALALSYLAAALVYAVFVYIERLRGHVGDKEIYAFDDKNSAGPIFLVAALLPFMLFQKNTIATVIIKIVNFCGFSLILLIAKCRATLVFLPIALLLIHIFLPKKKKAKIIATSSIFLVMAIGVVLLFAVPFLYQKIVVHFIFNDKKTIYDIFSGRIQRITETFKLFKDIRIVFLGTGSYYLDCMPMSILLTYGVVGTILLFPIFALPLYSVIKSKKYLNHKGTFFTITLIILLSLYFNGLFEAYGFIGTGTKVFILWLLAGYSYTFVLEDVKVKHLYNIVDIPAKASMKLKPSAFSLILLAVIVGSSCGLLASTSITDAIGKNIFKQLPTYQTVGTYNAPTTMEIDKDYFKKYLNYKMCEGQEIKFKSIVNPTNSDEIIQQYSKGWTHPEAIEIIEPQKGIVKAVSNTGNGVTTLQCFYPIHKNSKYIQFYVKTIENYNFDHLYIDNKPINYSFATIDNHKDFEANSNITMELKKGFSSKIYYDKYYFPKIDGKTSFQFKSSNENVATIDKDTGELVAVGSGECTISGEGNVENSQFQSPFKTNEINVVVSEEQVVPINSINFKNPGSFDQYISRKLDDFVEILPKTCSDKTFDLVVTNMDGSSAQDKFTYNTETTEIDFNTPGKYNLKFISRALNKDGGKINKTLEITVLENKPIKISSDLSWAIIGNKYDVKQLGLKLYFDRGWKYLEASDLQYNVHNIVTANRASSSRNGFCDGKLTTFMAVKAGSFGNTYVCKYDNNITYRMKITCNVYSKPRYEEICQNIGLIAVFVVLVISSLYLFCVQINNKFLYIITAAGYAGVISILTFMIYPFNSFTLGCVISFTAVVFIISIIRLTALNNKAVKLISED